MHVAPDPGPSRRSVALDGRGRNWMLQAHIVAPAAPGLASPRPQTVGFTDVYQASISAIRASAPKRSSA